MQKYFPWNVTSICPQMTPYSKGDTFSELWFYVKFRGCNHHWSTSDFLSRPEGCKFPMFSPRMRKYASPGWPSSFLGGLQNGYGIAPLFPSGWGLDPTTSSLVHHTKRLVTECPTPKPTTHTSQNPIETYPVVFFSLPKSRNFWRNIDQWLIFASDICNLIHGGYHCITY